MTEAHNWHFKFDVCLPCSMEPVTDWFVCTDCGGSGRGVHACQALHVLPDDEQKPETD